MKNLIFALAISIALADASSAQENIDIFSFDEMDPFDARDLFLRAAYANYYHTETPEGGLSRFKSSFIELSFSFLSERAAPSDLADILTQATEIFEKIDDETKIDFIKLTQRVEEGINIVFVDGSSREKLRVSAGAYSDLWLSAFDNFISDGENPCVSVPFMSAEGVRSQTLIYLNMDYSNSEIFSCLNRVIPHAFGFSEFVASPYETLLSPAYSGELSEIDFLLFDIMYDPSLSSGLTFEKTNIAVSQIVNEVFGASGDSCAEPETQIEISQPTRLEYSLTGSGYVPKTVGLTVLPDDFSYTVTRSDGSIFEMGRNFQQLIGRVEEVFYVIPERNWSSGAQLDIEVNSKTTEGTFLGVGVIRHLGFSKINSLLGMRCAMIIESETVAGDIHRFQRHYIDVASGVPIKAYWRTADDDLILQLYRLKSFSAI